MGLSIDTSALGRLVEHIAPADEMYLAISTYSGPVTIEWESGSAGQVNEAGRAIGDTPNEALAKLLAEIGDPGPCPVCGPARLLAHDEFCETCRTRAEAARWDAAIDEAMEAKA